MRTFIIQKMAQPVPQFPSNFRCAVCSLNLSSVSRAPLLTPLIAAHACVEADILSDQVDNGGGDCIREPSMDPIGERKLQRDRSEAVRCNSPRQIVDRLLAVLRPAKAQRILKETQNDTMSLSISRSMSGWNGHEDSASKNELAKMVELREEMEMLLQNLREELRRIEALLKTDVQEVSSSNSHLSAQSQKPYVQPELESKMVPNHFLKDIISEQDECVEKINELEAELEVELERLQLHLERETALQQHTQEGITKASDSEMGKNKASFLFLSGTLSASRLDSRPSSDGMSFHEIIDPLEASTELCIGVPPDELERRLHELLEARQQERIAELESALECAIKKLFQKEIEVTRWKDTVRIISVHVPETSRFTFQFDPETVLQLK